MSKSHMDMHLNMGWGEGHRFLWDLRLEKASAWGSSSQHASTRSLKSSCSVFSTLVVVPALSGLWHTNIYDQHSATTTTTILRLLKNKRSLRQFGSAILLLAFQCKACLIPAAVKGTRTNG